MTWKWSNLLEVMIAFQLFEQRTKMPINTGRRGRSDIRGFISFHSEEDQHRLVELM